MCIISVRFSESTRNWRVPFKSCQNRVLQHNLITIRLSVEWDARGGDNPNLVIDLIDKSKKTIVFSRLLFS